MVKSIWFKSAGKAALLAALVSGSALMAQEAPVVVTTEAAPPVVQAPMPDVVAPPPAVRTLPSANDTVNPAAAEQAAAERQPAAANRSARTRAATRPVGPIATYGIAPAAPPPAPPATTLNEPAAAPPPAATEMPSVASEGVITATMPTDAPDQMSTEDLTLFAGIAAALAALSLGGLFASRRRKRLVPQHDHGPVHAAAPVPQSQPSFPAVAQPAVNHPLVRNPAMSRPDIPVTDPLFSTPVRAAAITDPMFAPRNDVEIPITDPLFAKNARFNGRIRNEHSSMVREPVI